MTASRDASAAAESIAELEGLLKDSKAKVFRPNYFQMFLIRILFLLFHHPALCRRWRRRAASLS